MVTENEIEDAGGNEHEGIEERIQIPLAGGRFIDIRVSVASVPKVGPGPRPSLTEMLLMRRIDEDQVLTISAELTQGVAAAIVVSPGRPPGGGN